MEHTSRVTCLTQRVILASVMMITASMLWGCGDRMPRYPLSGAVTFGGQPVPFGRLILIPDESQGAKARRSVVIFKDGHYETPPDQYVLGGKYTVEIDGFSRSNESGDNDDVDDPRLFPVWSASVDLPPTGGSHDFDVPAGGKEIRRHQD